ncbi:phage tail protein [Mucilaginibacter sp. AW1-3]
MADTTYYPPVGFYFQVNVGSMNGANEGSFQSVSGLSYKLGVKEVPEGGENRFIHKFPAPAKYENITLKRGILTGSALISWAQTSLSQFTFTPVTVVIYLMDENASPLVTWNFVNAYPVSIKVEDLKSDGNTIAVESLELSYDYFTKS